MSADLVLGELDASLARHVGRIAKRIRLEGYSSFAGRPAGIVGSPSRIEPAKCITISAIKVASLDLFNSYAARLEGFRGPDAMDKTNIAMCPGGSNASGCR